MNGMTGELTCQELVELVTAYVEGALPAAQQARFEEHLAGCRGCRTYMEQMRQTIRAVGVLTAAALPTEAQQTLLATFRHWRRGQVG